MREPSISSGAKYFHYLGSVWPVVACSIIVTWWMFWDFVPENPVLNTELRDFSLQARKKVTPPFGEFFPFPISNLRKSAADTCSIYSCVGARLKCGFFVLPCLSLCLLLPWRPYLLIVSLLSQWKEGVVRAAWSYQKSLGGISDPSTHPGGKIEHLEDIKTYLVVENHRVQSVGLNI